MSSIKYIAHKREIDGKEQTVQEHLEGTGHSARLFAEKIGLSGIGELCGILHDFGKFSSDFQEYIKESFAAATKKAKGKNPKWKKGEIDHSTAGAQLVWNQKKNDDPISSYLYQIISLCLVSHHSGLIDCLSPAGKDVFTKRITKPLKDTRFDEVLQNCDEELLEKVDKLINSPQLVQQFMPLMRKVVDAKSKIIEQFRIGLLTRFLLSCLIDADRTNTADFESPDKSELRMKNSYPEWAEFIIILEENLKKFKNGNYVDKIRGQVSFSCKKKASQEQGIFTLSVPTGGGKTLASLRFGLEHAKKHNLKRLFFILPYITIIDQNAQTVREIFASLSDKYNTELILEHHSNLTPDEDTLQCKILSENWDAPIVFTTSVQFFECLFNKGTRGLRRMHQLSESVIIFDEIQSLPVRLVHLFNNAVNFLVDICRSSVVLCTATQPSLHLVNETKGALKVSKHREIVDNKISLFKNLSRVEVIDYTRPGGWQSSEVANLVKDELRKNKSVLVIVNTKRSAKDLFSICKNYSKNVYHLSTDMCPKHRMAKLKEIKEYLEPENNRSFKPVICISTQLIEAGVDIDFGTVIRYLAGFDSIAQAAGRCNRHGKRQCGRVFLINPAKENLSFLKDIEIGIENARRVLHEYHQSSQDFNGDLLHPKIMDVFFQYYFFNRANEMDYPLIKKEFGQNNTLLNLLSENKKVVETFCNQERKVPPMPLRQSFNSAARAFSVIESPTVGVIVPYAEGEKIITALCASSNIKTEFELIKSAQRYSVNCYAHTIEKLGIGQNGGLHDIQGSGILCLKREYYSEEFGISEYYLPEKSFPCFI